MGHCLIANLTSPVSGVLAIFLLGFVFGYVAHKGKSVAASTLSHMLNNLFNTQVTLGRLGRARRHTLSCGGGRNADV